LEDTATALSQLPLRELTTRLSSRAPVPGGGSAAAIAGALGAGLVSMVVELTAGRPEAADTTPELLEIGEAARRRRDDLLDLAEEDAAAYDAVVRARRLPRETDTEREAREQAVAAAMGQAADAPLRACRAAYEVLELAARVAPIGNPNAASDAGVAAQLASAGVRGAALNVRINLPYLAADDPLRSDGPAELERLERDAARLEAEVVDVVIGRIGPS
jgi:glutamate formiminotransferase/formiminotetrahydrofolate cyclodeaminase